MIPKEIQLAFTLPNSLPQVQHIQESRLSTKQPHVETLGFTIIDFYMAVRSYMLT